MYRANLLAWRNIDVFDWRSHLNQNNVGAGFRHANGDGLANATGAASNHGRVAL